MALFNSISSVWPRVFSSCLVYYPSNSTKDKKPLELIAPLRVRPAGRFAFSGRLRREAKQTTELPFRPAREKVDPITHTKSLTTDPITPGQKLIRRHSRNCEGNMEKKIVEESS